MAEKISSKPMSETDDSRESENNLYDKFKIAYLEALADRSFRDRLFKKYGCINESLLRRFTFIKDRVTDESNQIREDRRSFSDLPDWNRRAIVDAINEFVVLNRNFHVSTDSNDDYIDFQILRSNVNEPSGGDRPAESDSIEIDDKRRHILFEKKKQYYKKILCHPEIEDLLKIEGYIDQKIIRRYSSIRKIGNRILQDPREFTDLSEWDQRALVEAFREYVNENQDKCRLSEIEGKPPIISLREGEQFKIKRYIKPKDTVGEIRTRIQDDWNKNIH